MPRILKAVLLTGATLLTFVIALVGWFVMVNWSLLATKDPPVDQMELQWHSEQSKYATDAQTFAKQEASLKANVDNARQSTDAFSYMVALRKLADFYIGTGHYATAAANNGEAIDVAGKHDLAGSHPDELINVLDGQAYCFLQEDDYRRAADHAVAALALLARISKQHSLEAMYPRSTLIEAYSRMGKYLEASKEYEAFRRDFTKGSINKHRFDLGMPCAQVADFAVRIKDYKEAEFLYEDAHDTWRAAPGEDCLFNRGLVQARLAFLAMQTGKYDVAADRLAKAVQEFNELGPFGCEPKAVALFCLADAQWKAGAYIESWKTRLEARRLWRQPEI